MATWQMYFSFLTCEVKCGTAALDVADRQNAHSATLAIQSSKAEFMDWMAVESIIGPVDDRIVTVDSHRPVVMRD